MRRKVCIPHSIPIILAFSPLLQAILAGPITSEPVWPLIPLTDSFYTSIGLESESIMGIRYGLPALLSDVPGAVGGLIGVFQTANAYMRIPAMAGRA
jgi:hypothetical protein